MFILAHFKRSIREKGILKDGAVHKKVENTEEKRVNAGYHNNNNNNNNNKFFIYRR